MTNNFEPSADAIKQLPPRPLMSSFEGKADQVCVCNQEE